ncbi:hypothetical protein [Rhodoferax aquaticus]|uniref:Uncharacterized protein n=1 Tax=Rhodoferax aquaticus TaxID=2527691 RepID=A0A515ERS9_9BURK|nr:hypothetical protein [Rhodoferax aquaticus]QDL55348.1 hypothetical protein EXZ61_14860 [Rhodoferax aquaticus]
MNLPYPPAPSQRRLTTLRAVMAVTAALWFGALHAQTTATSPSQDLPEIKFRDFFRSSSKAGGLELGDALLQAKGTSARLVGYMVKQETPSLGRFMLTPRPVQMSEHADGEADDLPVATVMVYLDPSQSAWVVPHTRGLIEVRGVVDVGRFEEKDGRVSWIRMQLAPEATKGMNPMELAMYLHNQQHQH